MPLLLLVRLTCIGATPSVANSWRRCCCSKGVAALPVAAGGGERDPVAVGDSPEAPAAAAAARAGAGPGRLRAGGTSRGLPDSTLCCCALLPGTNTAPLTATLPAGAGLKAARLCGAWGTAAAATWAGSSTCITGAVAEPCCVDCPTRVVCTEGCQRRTAAATATSTPSDL